MQFSKEQQQAFNAMIAGENVFISGEGGTGKSFVIREFCKKRNGCVLLAPTGVAAMNINGRTLHSFFHLPPHLLSTETIANFLQNFRQDTGTTDSSYSRHAPDVITQLRDNLNNTEVIIIDEISMVRSDIFWAINRLLQLAKENNLPFGGLQMILTGDFYQLPPVSSCSVEYDYLQSAYGGIYAFQTQAWRDGNFHNIFLRHNFRQAEGVEDLFLSILRRLRKAGKNALNHSEILLATNEAISQLNEVCFLKHENSDYSLPSTLSHVICTDNATANQINTCKLSELHGYQCIVDATVSGEFPESEYPTQKQLCLKAGAKVMLLKNDKRRGYVNGDFGELLEIVEGKFAVPNFRIKLERSGEIVEVRYPHSWEYSEYYIDPGNPIPKQRVLGTFRQFPIRLAYASTVHKSQGRTLDSVCLVKGQKGFFASGQLYTALSRCRTISGLHLYDKISLQDVIVDDAVVDFYQQFDNTAQQ